MPMDVKQAVATARTYIGDLFADEGVSNLGLEEVEYDVDKGEWRVTMGFSRPWDTSGRVSPLDLTPSRPRSYKIVRISGREERVISVTNK